MHRELVKYIFVMNNFLTMRFIAMFNSSWHILLLFFCAPIVGRSLILHFDKWQTNVLCKYGIFVKRNASNDIKLNEWKDERQHIGIYENICQRKIASQHSVWLVQNGSSGVNLALNNIYEYAEMRAKGNHHKTSDPILYELITVWNVCKRFLDLFRTTVMNLKMYAMELMGKMHSRRLQSK